MVDITTLRELAAQVISDTSLVSMARQTIRLCDEVERLRERLAMATRFRNADGAIFTVVSDGGCEVMLPRSVQDIMACKPERYLRVDGSVHLITDPLPADIMALTFPTADAAFAAYETWKASQ